MGYLLLRISLLCLSYSQFTRGQFHGFNRSETDDPATPYFAEPALTGNPGIEQYVINGRTAFPGQFPYIAKLEIDNGMCAGSLISHTHLLSAAHCFMRSRSGVRVRLGLSVEDLDELEEAVDVPAENIVLHPEYSPEDYSHDIALIKLPKRVRYNRLINRIMLPSKKFKSPASIDNKVATVAGWGHSSVDVHEVSESLLFAKLRLTRYQECKGKDVGRGNAVCTSYQRSGPCMGDSGGPLTVRGPMGRPSLVGIVSYNMAPVGRFCDEGSFTFYTYVPSYIDWINQVTKQ